MTSHTLMLASPSPKTTQPKAPAKKTEVKASNDKEPPKDSVSLGYKVLRGGVATVGAGAGIVLGSVVGAAKQAGADQVKTPKLARRALGFIGAAAGLGAAMLVAPALGPLGALGALVVGPIVGAAAGGGLPEATVGAFSGMKDGASLGWQLAGGFVDKVSGLFSSKEQDPPSDPKPPTDPPKAKPEPPKAKPEASPPKS